MRLLCLAAMALCLAACETAEDVRLAGAAGGPIELRVVDPDTGAGVADVVVAIHAEDGVTIDEQATTDSSGLVRYDGGRNRATVTIAYRVDDEAAGRPWRVDTYLDFPLQSLTYPLRTQLSGFPPFTEPGDSYTIEAVSTVGSDEPMAFSPGGFLALPDDGIARDSFEIGTFSNGTDTQESVLVTQQVGDDVHYQFDLDYTATVDTVRSLALSRIDQPLAWNERNDALVNSLSIDGLRKGTWFEVGGEFREQGAARSSGTTHFLADMPVEAYSYQGAFLVQGPNTFEAVRHELRRDSALDTWTITLPTQRVVDLTVDASGQLAVELDGATVDPRMSYLSVFLDNDAGDEWNINGPSSRLNYQLPVLPTGPDAVFPSDRNRLQDQVHFVLLRGNDGFPTADQFAVGLARLDATGATAITDLVSSLYVSFGQAGQAGSAVQKSAARTHAARLLDELR